MTIRRVLVFPAGTEVGLEIHQALKSCKDIKLFGAGQATSNHAPFVYEQYRELPNILEQNWLPSLIALCHELNIDYIFPAYDDVIVALAEYAKDIPAVVLAPSKEISLITRSKSLTYEALSSKVKVPNIYTKQSAKSYPLLVKPDKGQGSQGVTVVNNDQELDDALRLLKEPLISEFLPGEEFTIDCFSDREKGVLFCGARVRLRMRNGIAVHTKIVQLPEANEIAENINSVLQLHGAWFFQLKRSKNGILTLLEVAPRIAGSMSAHRVQGVNFPLLTIFEHERLPIKLMPLNVNIELDRALLNRYHTNIDFEALYIDLDDTLIFRNQVNLDALHLIYDCINKGVPVILITRHAGNVEETLLRYRLVGVFDEIIHITDGSCKSEKILRDKAIFVDDSFSERQRVQSKLDIPVFDCSMIEVLINSKPKINTES